MLIEFTVGNYRSIRDTVTLSLVASRQKSRDPALDENSLIHIDKNLTLLRTAAIYGANASGKSNIIRAMSFFRGFVRNSVREGQSGDSVAVEAFALATDTVDQPCHFEIVFLLDGQQFRYGFEATREKVTKEWLYCVPTTREVELFYREDQAITFHSHRFREGRGLEQKTRPNALFLSVVAQFNGVTADKIVQSIYSGCQTITGLNDEIHVSTTMNRLRSEIYRDQVIELIRRLDVGVTGLTLRMERPETTGGHDSDEEFIDSVLDEFARRGPGTNLRHDGEGGYFFDTLLSEHKVRDSKGHVIGTQKFSTARMESEGTRKLIDLAGPLFDVLENGLVLWMDEFDARLHPAITRTIVGLFNSHAANRHNAQLIFVTHDTNLLDRDLLRRDQIWFTEKDQQEATRLYSLAEFEVEPKLKVRNDASYENDYMQGRYGAIPFLSDIATLFRGDTDNVEAVLEKTAIAAG